ncbi:MAG TPA: hypothetical protein ENK43_17635 [Planctomycetes bacterium]|nr:hypothetical protein [Planctomycetota bacterium]
MEKPLQIIWRHMEEDDETRALVEERMAKLDSQLPSITSCVVTVEASKTFPNGTSEYTVKAVMHLVRDEVLVQTETANDPKEAVREVFNHLKRRAHEFFEKLQS